MFKRGLVTIMLVLCLVSLSWAQSPSAAETEKGIKEYLAHISEMVEYFNQNSSNDIGSIVLLNEVLKTTTGKNYLNSWVALTWLGCYYKDCQLLHPEKRQTFAGSTFFVEQVERERLGVFKTTLKAGAPKEVVETMKLMPSVIKRIQQATKIAYLKSPTRI